MASMASNTPRWLSRQNRFQTLFHAPNSAGKARQVTRRRCVPIALQTTGERQVSLTDPDNRAMAGHTRVAVGYNVQLAVDAMHKLIVEQEVTNQRSEEHTSELQS